MSAEIASSFNAAENYLSDSLAEYCHDMEPQLGYRVELSTIALSDISRRYNMRREIKRLVTKSYDNLDIENTGRFIYLYNPATDKIELNTLRLSLLDRIHDEHGTVLADSIYLQRYTEGFVQTVGLGRETVSEAAPVLPLDHAHDSIRSLFSPFNLYDIPKSEWRQLDIAHKLTSSPNWRVREEQTVPLPPRTDDTVGQLIIGRTRQAHTDTLSDTTSYHDTYDISLQEIEPTLEIADPGAKIIEQTTVKIDHDLPGKRASSLVEASFWRYDYPLAAGVTDIRNYQAERRPLTAEQIGLFIQLFQRYVIPPQI